MEEEPQNQQSPSPSPPPLPSDSQSQTNQEPSPIKEEPEQETSLEKFQELEDEMAPSSLDNGENHIEEEEEGKDEAEAVEEESAEHGGAAVLTDVLRDQIVRQVEYYFSDENLPTDKFMWKYVRKDKQGFVPIAVIASFRKMTKLVQDLSLIEASLRTSSQLVLSKDGKKVRRLHPLSVTEIKDTKSCTVIVENLPDDHSKDNLRKIFASIGKIVNITVHDPHSTEESKITKAISSKLHALIEYETPDVAASAVATLNDEKNWRTGMRVELLVKWMKKYVAYGRGHREKETFSEKKNDNHSSEIASEGQKLKSDDPHDVKEEEEHIAGGKGRRKNRYKSRGRGQPNASGQGHGQITSSSSNGASKPISGPKMPDGTRGFTMGRGKPCISEPSLSVPN